jgi:hypothetical protein
MTKLIVAFRSFATSSKNNNISSFTRDSNRLADSPSKLIRWKKYFPQLLNVREFSDIKHTAEPPASEPSVFDSVMAVGVIKE